MVPAAARSAGWKPTFRHQAIEWCDRTIMLGSARLRFQSCRPPCPSFDLPVRVVRPGQPTISGRQKKRRPGWLPRPPIDLQAKETKTGQRVPARIRPNSGLSPPIRTLPTSAVLADCYALAQSSGSRRRSEPCSCPRRSQGSDEFRAQALDSDFCIRIFSSSGNTPPAALRRA